MKQEDELTRLRRENKELKNTLSIMFNESVVLLRQMNKTLEQLREQKFRS